MRESLLKKKIDNLFYIKTGLRWVRRKSPLCFHDFIRCLRDNSSFCPDDDKLDLDKAKAYYDTYLFSFIELEIPKYKKSKGSIYFGFTRSNASIDFYLDRAYLPIFAKEILAKRQNTISLESFITKYGEAEGKTRFNNYVNKWKNSISKHDKKILYSKWKNLPEYYLNKINPETGLNYTLIEANSKIADDLSKGFKKVWMEYREGKREKMQVNTTLDYYLSKGMTTDEATIALKERQSTFSLEKCIHKYGVEKGKEIFNKRNEKWLNTLDNKSNDEKKEILMKKTRGLPRYSRESKEFFDSLMERIKYLLNDDVDVYYGSNEMILWNREKFRPYFYDFSIPLYKIIIEYNGSAFHPNYSLLTHEQLEKWICPYTKQNANDKHIIDQYKINFAKSLGYNVIEIWDTDQYDKKMNTCIEFIIENIKKNKNGN